MKDRLVRRTGKILKTLAAFEALDEENKSAATRARAHGINEKRETLGGFHKLVQELKKIRNYFTCIFE